MSAIILFCPDYSGLVGVVLFEAALNSFCNKQGTDSHSTEIKLTAVQSTSQDCYEYQME